MGAQRVLFIGGTGIISSACVARALEVGHEVTVVNRGATSTRPLPDGVEVLNADVRDADAMRSALADRDLDVVAQFVAFTPDHVAADLELLRGRVGQYVFISSASAYQTPPGRLPITESTPLVNPHWRYSQDKIACEQLLVEAHRESGFPATIVRPSHTYDRTSIPTMGGWTDIARMRRGAPVVVHGDGSSLWVLTHHTDFAHAFVGLLGHPHAVGDAFHITSDEPLSWDRVYRDLAHAAGVDDPELVHVPSDRIAAADPDLGASLLGDKTHSVIFDNAKVKRLVPDYVATTPFWRGAQQIIEWYDSDPSRQQVDPARDDLFDHLVADVVGR